MTEADLKEDDAWRAKQAGRYEEAARLYEPLAAQGNVRAVFNLGVMYERGNLGHRDEKKAISLWERAAHGGYAPAKYHLGRLFEDKGDFSSARKWYIEGAKQNHKPSMYIGGRMLMRGQGGEVESRAGYELLVRAADGGHAFAQRHLLRLQIQDTRSLWARLKLYRKLFQFFLSVIPRLVRDPYSEDFK